MSNLSFFASTNENADVNNADGFTNQNFLTAEKQKPPSQWTLADQPEQINDDSKLDISLKPNEDKTDSPKRKWTRKLIEGGEETLHELSSRREVEVEVGSSVMIPFADPFGNEGWYTGQILVALKNYNGLVYQITIKYDDNGEIEESRWPDESIVLVGSNSNGIGINSSNNNSQNNNYGNSISNSIDAFSCYSVNSYCNTAVASTTVPSTAVDDLALHDFANVASTTTIPIPNSIPRIQYATAEDIELPSIYKGEDKQIGKLGGFSFACGEEDCDYVSNSSTSVKRHRSMLHSIDCFYFPCAVDGCLYKKAKTYGNLKRHMIVVHGINPSVGKSSSASKSKRNSKRKKV